MLMVESGTQFHVKKIDFTDTLHIQEEGSAHIRVNLSLRFQAHCCRNIHNV